MTRQHFDYLARGPGPAPAGGDVVKHFAYHLADTNARFDADRFISSSDQKGTENV